MASVRLNQEMRKVVRSRLMTHAFGERWEQLHADEFSLADDVYEDIYPAALLRKMRALPDGFLAKSCDFAVNFGGQRVRLKFKECRFIANCHCTWEGAKSYDASHELSVRNFELEKRRRSLSEEQDRAGRSVEAVLDSCTTVKGLLEVWPEAESFVKDFAASRPVLALTVSVKDLNSQLGLPGRPSSPGGRG